MNLILDFDKLVEALPFDHQDLKGAEVGALLGLGLLDKFSLQSTEKEALRSHLGSFLKDKETNFFNQLATFVGNFLDPAWRDPEHRPRIDAAESWPKRNPTISAKGLVGSWKSKWEDEESEGDYSISKFVNQEDGTYFSESMDASKEGYQLEGNKRDLKVVGSSI